MIIAALTLRHIHRLQAEGVAGKPNPKFKEASRCLFVVFPRVGEEVSLGVHQHPSVMISLLALGLV